MKLYLAHPIESRKYVREWELKMKKKFPNINFVNPFHHPLSFEMLNEDDIDDSDYFKKLKYKELVETDIKFIKATDGTLAIVDSALSYGTIMEIVYAKLNGKKTYMINTIKTDEHPWFKYHIDHTFTSFEEFEKFLIHKQKI